MLPLDKKTYETIRVKNRDLISMIEPRNGLVDALLAKHCISRSQQAVLDRDCSSNHSNKNLLEIISRKSLADFDIFIGCLIETEQDHVAELLTNNAGNFIVLRL